MRRNGETRCHIGGALPLSRIGERAFDHDRAACGQHVVRRAPCRLPGGREPQNSRPGHWCCLGCEHGGQVRPVGIAVTAQKNQHRVARRQKIDAGMHMMPRLCQQTGRLPRVRPALRSASQRITSGRGTQRQKQRQDKQPVGFRREVHPGVEYGVAEIAATAQLQIHQQEREVVQDVDTADFVAELDTVK